MPVTVGLKTAGDGDETVTKPKRTREETLAIALGTAAMVLMLFLLYNQLSTLKAGYADVARERALLNQTRASYQELTALKSQALEMRQYLTGLQNAIPETPGEDILIYDISSYAASTGSDLLQIQFAQRVSRDKYVEMPVNIALTANYRDMLDMLNHLQNGGRALRIEEFTMSGGDQLSPVIKADITAIAFYTD